MKKCRRMGNQSEIPMARPIEPTPVLEGKDAQRFLRDFRKYKLTPKKEKELKKCAKLYEKMRPQCVYGYRSKS